MLRLLSQLKKSEGTPPADGNVQAYKKEEVRVANELGEGGGKV